MMSRPSKFCRQDDDEHLFQCEECCYGTTKRSNYIRHLKSDRHNTLFKSLKDGPSELQTEVIENQFEIEVDSDDDDEPVPQSLTQAEDEDVNSNLESDIDEEININCTPPPPHFESENEWFPFTSRIHFLLSVLYSSKTHRVSDEVMSFILFILTESGVKDVPTLQTVKTFLQKQINTEEMIKRHEDKEGNINWTIKPSWMLKLQLANPDIAKKIARYPIVEKPEESVHQAAGTKWKKMEFHWARDGKGQQYFSGNFVTFQYRGQTVHGQIKQFLENLKEDTIYAKVLVFLDHTHRTVSNLQVNENCLVKINKSLTIQLDICQKLDTSFVKSMKEVSDGYATDISEQEVEDIITDQSSLQQRGLPVVTVPLNIFMDDMSANTSRRWSPIHAAQGQLSGLPLDDKNRGKNVFFLGMSDKMSMLDVMVPICEDIHNCKRFGVEGFDAATMQKCIITTDISLLITDYQMTSLACNHLGSSASKFCPKCYADDSDPFSKGEPRTKEGILRTRNRLKNLSTGQKIALQRQTGTKDYENCLWDYVNPLRDTPIGILHFIYLGLAKQLIRFCYDTLSDPQKSLLEIHLDSIDQSSFSYKVHNSFFKYMDSRQGKDFKHYLQIAALNMAFAGLSQNYVTVLDKLAMISKHILQRCHPEEIEREIEAYLEVIKEKIPSLGKKRKTHLCVHMGDDMKQHGHPLQFSEDSFEKNHKLVRSSIFHQNGHAKSRDTALQFLNNELIAHLILGGYLPASETWKPASINVKKYCSSKAVLNYLGMPELTSEDTSLQLKNMVTKQKDISIAEVYILQGILNCGGSASVLQSPHLKVTEYMACSEHIKLESFVLYKDVDNVNHIGQIKKLFRLCWKGNNHQLSLIQKSELCPTLQSEFQVLQQLPEAALSVVLVQSIVQVLHVVHDCKGGKCKVEEGTRLTKIEQELQHVKYSYLKHSPHHLYFINKCRISLSVDKIAL